MEFADFRATYEKDVRSWLDWDTLAAFAPTVSRLQLESPGELGRLSTVWYVDQNNCISDWRDPTARRLRVVEAADDRMREAHGSGSAGLVDEMTSIARAGACLFESPIPLYRVSSEELLLIDGNHRCIAMLRYGRSVSVVAAVIEGPRDPFILPDLLHRSDTEGSAWSDAVERIDRHFSAHVRN